MHILTLLADPAPAAQVDWLNLSDPTNLVRLIGFVIPILTALVTKRLASQGLKSVVTTALSAITAGTAVLVSDNGHSFAWQAFVNAFINAFVPAIVAYYGLWKPTGVTGSVALATHRFGIGPRPVLETAAKGQDSPPAAAGSPEAGASSLALLLVVAGAILLAIGFFIAAYHLLVVVGIIVLVIGLVVAVAQNRTL